MCKITHVKVIKDGNIFFLVTKTWKHFIQKQPLFIKMVIYIFIIKCTSYNANLLLKTSNMHKFIGTCQIIECT